MTKTTLIILTMAFFPVFAESKKNNALNKKEAISLAVKISNAECQKIFKVAPFDSSSFKIEFKNGYWQWGGLDFKGEDGYSAFVKFDKYGKNDTVEVFFSIDVDRGEERLIKEKK